MPPLSHVDFATMPPADAKKAWRAAVRDNRERRGSRRNEDHALALRNLVMTLPEADGIAVASIYAARPKEPGTLPLIEAFSALGIKVLVPCLGNGLQRGWGYFSSTADLIERAPNRPPEPSGDFLEPSRLAEADLIVVPALGVDSTGTRLGQGGGWYDRALADARPDATIAALVFDDEFHDAAERAIPRETHDVAVSIVVTPSAVHRIGD